MQTVRPGGVESFFCLFWLVDSVGVCMGRHALCFLGDEHLLVGLHTPASDFLIRRQGDRERCLNATSPKNQPDPEDCLL